MVRAEEIEVYGCGSCGEEYEYETDAEECCPNFCDRMERFRCSECKEVYIDEDEAEDCCK